MARTAVITGASAGVGRATVRAFAERGYDVGLLARNEAGLEAAQQEAREAGARTTTAVVDVADAQQVESAAQRVEEELGPIDVWVNNAMASVFSPFLEMTTEEFHRVVDVTFLGCVHGTRAALDRMTPRNHGAVVQVGSALAYRGIPLQSAYCASKHAIQGFCDSVRTELHHDDSDVRIAMVQLPAVNTPQFDVQRNKMRAKPQPVPPIFQPEVAARAIVYAAEHECRELWVGTPTVRAILGTRLLPGALDRFLGQTGYRSQQRDEPAEPDHEDVLFSPLERDLGAHGSFDRQARSGSKQLDLSLSPPVTRLRERVRPGVEKAVARLLTRVLGGQPPGAQ